jgi:hypothetical protein
MKWPQGTGRAGKDLLSLSYSMLCGFSVYQIKANQCSLSEGLIDYFQWALEDKFEQNS